MENIIQTLAFIGAIETVVLFVGIVWAFALWARGILPVLVRIGNGLAKRKIIVFAKGDNMNSLTTLLTDSGLFFEKEHLRYHKNRGLWTR